MPHPNQPGATPRVAPQKPRRPEGAGHFVSPFQGSTTRGRPTRGVAPGWFVVLLRSVNFGFRVKSGLATVGLEVEVEKQAFPMSSLSPTEAWLPAFAAGQELASSRSAPSVARLSAGHPGGEGSMAGGSPCTVGVKARRVGGKFQRVGGKFSGIGEKVRTIGEKLCGVGEKFTGVGEKFSGVGEKFSGVGEKFS